MTPHLYKRDTPREVNELFVWPASHRSAVQNPKLFVVQQYPGKLQAQDANFYFLAAASSSGLTASKLFVVDFATTGYCNGQKKSPALGGGLSYFLESENKFSLEYWWLALTAEICSATHTTIGQDF